MLRLAKTCNAQHPLPNPVEWEGSRCAAYCGSCLGVPIFGTGRCGYQGHSPWLVREWLGSGPGPFH